MPSSGSRLNGTPCGSSPMMPLGCAPHGLKYRSSAPFHCSKGFPAFCRLRRCASTWSVMTISTVDFVRP